MAQPPLHLIIGNYNTSSWSLRAWLVLRLARLAFVETRIPLRRPETPGRIAQVSPSGKLPVLLAEGVPIWDSLAIAEFVAELEPGTWPLDPIARAEARAISAEMHSGFAELRRLMPMDVVGRFSAPGRLPRGLAADIDRIKAIWSHCRARFAPHGPFLFGAFSIADCMMAPVATRFVTHGVPIEGAVEDYVDSVMSWPDMVTWCDAAAAEQEQRELQGSLGVVDVTRPGRVLGREADEAPAAAVEQPDEPAAALPAEPRSPIPSEAETVAAAAATVAASTAPPSDTADERGSAAVAAPEAAPAAAGAAEPAAEPSTLPPASPAARSAGEPAPAGHPSTRRRLFEPEQPTEPPAAQPPAAQPPAAAAADGPMVPEDAADAEAPPPAAHEAPLPTAPRLGWIRRPVPVDQLEPGDVPAGGPPPRSPAPARPSSPAVKPIGGGILRRR